MNDNQIIKLDELMQKIKQKLTLPNHNFDLVVAIGRGGILPGYLASSYLDIPMEIIQLEFRNDAHQAIHDTPQLLGPLGFETANKRVLLTDDVANTGASLNKAKTLLQGAIITTLVISGNGDISLFGKHDRCITWPWQ